MFFLIQSLQNPILQRLAASSRTIRTKNRIAREGNKTQRPTRKIFQFEVSSATQKSFPSMLFTVANKSHRNGNYVFVFVLSTEIFLTINRAAFKNLRETCSYRGIKIRPPSALAPRRKPRSGGRCGSFHPNRLHAGPHLFGLPGN